MKEPFEPSPYLSDDINRAISESELAGGCNFSSFPDGRVLKVQTRNTLYELKRENGSEFIRGSKKYCPEWTACAIQGSTFGGSMLKLKFIGRGMFMEFSLQGKTITTSQIQEISEE